MKAERRNRLAVAAVASAVGLGALTYGLRAIPAVQQAIARLRPQGGSGGSTNVAAATPGGSIVRNAFLLTGQGTTTADINNRLRKLRRVAAKMTAKAMPGKDRDTATATSRTDP